MRKLATEAWFRRRSFDRAARCYDSVSDVQRSMAGRLVELLAEVNDPEELLEIGCGTGHLSEHLVRRCAGARFLFTDVSRAMLERSRERFRGTSGTSMRWRELDARGPRWDLQERFHLVASSAVVQWFQDLAAHLAGVAQHLLPGGCYLVAGFRRDNLPELASTLMRFDVALNVGHSRMDLEAGCRAAGLRIVRFETEAVIREYAGARELLQALRSMGASRYPGKRPLASRALQEVMRNYEIDNACPHGVLATWVAWYALLSR